ncbi:lactaldehyde reductase [Weizmannia acidilactici]|uniref:lactaldehyde reductase n=1 Tax=Weizmannia acidilactici TaxID=2607726 RepID=UPI00266C541E|nr:lactaldehyde reductase [Weizmannia acidilactici]
MVTDADLVKFGVVKKITYLLDENGLTYEIFDRTVPNPTIAVVKAGVEAYKKAGADYIIAIGGGSPIDTSKGIDIIITNLEHADVLSLEGDPGTKNPSAPILAVPTTSGTAAEVTINYVITDENNHRKFVCVDAHDIPVVAFVDSDMMMSMPKGLCASTGMDALTHAIEGYITKGAWELTDMMHIKAIEIIGRSLRASVTGDKKAREDMALAQYIAGMGFSNVGLGLVHGMAHPLSAWYNAPHGVACATLLPTILKYNAAYTGEKYRDIAKALGVKGVESMSLEEAKEAAVEAVAWLGKDIGIPQSLDELGVKKEDIPNITKDAFADVCTGGNPRDTSVEEIEALYKSLLHGSVVTA